MLRFLCLTVLSIAITLTAALPAWAAQRVFTVSQVEANLRSLHGKTVRVQGQMNNCESLTCSICVDGDEDAVCLPISFLADSDQTRSLIELTYRFATIAVEARIDATCQLGFDPSERSSRSPDEIIVCTDRSQALVDARVLSVHVRRSATAGRFDMYEGEPLSAPSPEQRVGILAGWDTWQKRMALRPRDDDEIEVFVGAPYPEDQESGLALCICREDSCKGKWPTKSGHFTWSPGNPYDCWRAELYGDRWVFLR
ncbi:MAG: hypothetical protein Q7U20_06070 [Caulobacter sp.]|nr:hypothetical protein [Caulobacter sp.]